MESELFVLKKDWVIKCQNCGCDSHCGETCKRKQNHYPVDGYFEYEIEVSKQCRCEAC